MFDRATLKENLTKCVGDVEFTKADGTSRKMMCTLMPEYLPAMAIGETVRHVPRKENDDTLAVWDLEKDAWRSFRVDSIVKISYIGVNRV